ncbi:MAG: MarR family transcriptional regulator [Roseburia sp.]|uniref:MarR family transcriptional regulator n=1 Tax=Roseburia hominis TaxID=301301 RepID=UPI003035CB5E|nr:MarR family transcriptional regulator [Roseburia hominis]
MIIQSLQQPSFSELAEKFNVTKPAVTAIIRKLSSMGLVEKSNQKQIGDFFMSYLLKRGKNLRRRPRCICLGDPDTL